MHYDANGSPVEGPEHSTDAPVRQVPNTLKSVRSLFPGFNFLGESPFPSHRCVVPNDCESTVTDSTEDDYHVVVLVDSRFRSWGTFQVMRPYTAYDAEEKMTLYGWVDKSGNFVSHGEHPVFEPDHSKVVAWKPCPRDFDLRA